MVFCSGSGVMILVKSCLHEQSRAEQDRDLTMILTAHAACLADERCIVGAF